MPFARRLVIALAVTPSLTLGLLLHAQTPAPAQTTAPLNLHQWGAVTLFHGLPSDHVRAIAQTDDGTLWFGTDGGLARYDGRRTQTVAVAPVHALARDASGTLWAGTDSGAGRVIDGALQIVAGTEDLSVTAIAPSPSGVVTLASVGGGVAWCRPGTRPADPPEVERPDPAVFSPVLHVGANPLPLTSLADVGDRVLIGTRGRGLLYFGDTPILELNSRPRPFFVEAIAVDARGHAWYGAQAKADEGGVYDATDLARPVRLPGPTGTVNALAFDAAGDLWAGTDERGAIRYRGGREAERVTFEGSAGGLRSDRVYAVFVDREGVVWFGTDRGACRYDPRSPRVEAISDEPDGNFVRALAVDAAGRTWCGTNRGLFAAEPGGPWRAVEGFERRVVYAVADAGDGVVVGTGGGLFVVRPGAAPAPVEGSTGDSGGVRAVRVFRGRVYAAVFGRGLARLDGDRLDLVWPAESANARWRDVVSLFADGDDRLWIGTATAGAFAFDGASVAAALAPLAGDAVWGMDRDPGGTLWVATERGLFSATGDAVEPALEGVEARCVAAAAGATWCGTASGGVFVVGRDPENGPVVARLDTEHGLPSNGVFALARCREADPACEALWIGTSRGVARYEPGRVAPGLRVTRALGARAYEPAEVAAGIALEYPQTSLALDVAAASSRTFPEQFQYAFAVYDAKDRIVTKRLSHDAQLTLENLRPGRYRVEARAYSNDLVASEPLTVRFEVERAPFPWGVAALSLLLALALVALWWGAAQNRRLAGANRELREARLQLAHETEAERRRIARDLHDQTLADLRLLMMQTDAEPGGGPLRGEVEAISNEIRRICEDLSPSVLANVGLTAALEWALANAVAHLPEGEKFEYEFACDDGVEERLALDATSRIQVYRIVQEAVNNVCRHARATRVRLSAGIDEEGAFAVELEDDGRGFEGASRRTGRGLANIRSRANMIGAEVSWRRRPSGGTRFRLRV